MVARGSLLARALFALERYREAISAFDAALALKPDDSDALSNRGSALRELGHHDAAIASFDKALVVTPRHAGALMGRGIIGPNFAPFLQ